jgi:hypothetical protein
MDDDVVPGSFPSLGGVWEPQMKENWSNVEPEEWKTIESGRFLVVSLLCMYPILALALPY